jgi:putative MATE family efflux protein
MQILLRFSVPLLIGNVAQQLFAIFDAVIVGRFSLQQEAAISTIAACHSIYNLLIVVFLAIATGTGIMVSQYMGARDSERLTSAIGTSLTLVLLSSILITIACIPNVSRLLRWIHTPEEVSNSAGEYLTIILIGLTASGLYNLLACLLRSMGDAFWPLILLLSSLVLNMVMQLWFVIGLHWGAQGSAWAFVISQATAALLCIGRLSRLKGAVNCGEITLRIDRRLIGQIVTLSIPAGIAQFALSICILLLQRLINQMGVNAIVASMAVMNVDEFATMHCFTFGHAISTLVGQNIGANRPDRVEKGIQDALRLSLGVTLAMSLLFVLIGQYVVRWFSNTAQIQGISAHAFQILAVSHLALSIGQVYNGAIRGSGDTISTMWITIGSQFIVRVPVAYLLADMLRSPEWPQGSPYALFCALLVTRFATAAANHFWFRRSEWRTRSLVHGMPDRGLIIEKSHDTGTFK